MARLIERRARLAAVVGALAVLTGCAAFGGSSVAAALTATAASDVAALPNGAWGVSAYDGYVVFSRRVPTTNLPANRWALMDWHDGTLTALAVPARSFPFDASVGQAANGDPTVVYSRCASDPSYGIYEQELNWAGARGCRIWELDLKGGTAHRVSAIGGANTATDALAFTRKGSRGEVRGP
ncbi:MAG TPA: hypothetical protein VIJ11_00120 [Galbitalea sp.]